MPGFMGLAGRGDRSRYIGRTNGATVANDLLGAAGMGVKSFLVGHDTKLLDVAIDAVKGNVGADNKPVEGIATSESVQAVTEQVSASIISQKEGLVEVVNINQEPDTVNIIMGYWPDDSKGIIVAPKDTIDATLRDSKTGRVIKILKIWPGL